MARNEYRKTRQYVVYRGSQFVVEGTSVECAEKLGIKLPHFYSLSTPSHRYKVTSKNGLYAYKLSELIKDELEDEEMICPVCREKARVIDKRDVSEHYTVHRTYECKECLTHFKSSEKILFTSIPKYIRDKFLDEGKR